jgi:sulfopyruvate decarboxylase TPP-binding subunit
MRLKVENTSAAPLLKLSPENAGEELQITELCQLMKFHEVPYLILASHMGEMNTLAIPLGQKSSSIPRSRIQHVSYPHHP